MNLIKQYNENMLNVLKKIDDTQMDEINEAAKLISKTIASDGLVQAFGSGHSFAGAIEIAGRAGGFIQTKAIDHFYGINGWLEVVPGVGSAYIKHVDLRVEDTFVIISNSGKNPLHVEFAKHIAEQGVKLIIICNKGDAKKNAELGDSIINYADVIIDNCGFSGDCSIELEQYPIKVAPTSSMAVSHIVSMMMLTAIENLIDQGIEPPIFRSANVDGGREYNQGLRKKFVHRLNRR